MIYNDLQWSRPLISETTDTNFSDRKIDKIKIKFLLREKTALLGEGKNLRKNLINMNDFEIFVSVYERKTREKTCFYAFSTNHYEFCVFS